MEASASDCRRPTRDFIIVFYTAGSRTDGERLFLVTNNNHILLSVKNI